MSKIELQFHGEPDEVLVLISKWAGNYDLNVAVEQFFPAYRALSAPNSEIKEVAGKLEQVDRVSLGLRGLDVSAPTAHEFTARNPDCLFVSLGARTDDGLRESAIGGITTDAETLSIWRTLTRDAKSAMHRGASVRNPHSGAVLPVPNHLHTFRAHELAKQGIKMLAAAGWNEFEFDDCVQAEPATSRRGSKA